MDSSGWWYSALKDHAPSSDGNAPNRELGYYGTATSSDKESTELSRQFTATDEVTVKWGALFHP